MSFFSNVILCSLIGLLLFCSSSSSYLYYKEPEVLDSACSGQPNTGAPWIGKPTLVKQVENGSLYTAGDGEDQLYGKGRIKRTITLYVHECHPSSLAVLHVYGSPYAMGYAHGQLLREQVQEMLPAFMKHLESELDQYLKYMPKFLQQIIEEYSLDEVLDLTYDLTK